MSPNQLDIRATNGESISEHWKDGLSTVMGISLYHFPNMFFMYGPLAPTAFSSGPSCVQIQARWLVATLKELRERGVDRFEATQEMEREWTKRTNDIWNKSLFPCTRSWYHGLNIPCKRIEALN